MLSANDLLLVGVGLGVKLLLMPAYHSTDFEVHRNWLALTHSEWTLDYPPFFAWFEWALSQAARLWDARIRLTVIGSELVLLWALWRAVRLAGGSVSARTAAVLGFLSPGLVFVDHVHFQYNGFLLGLLVLSLTLAMEGRDLLSGVVFAVLLCFKHIFMYIAPAYFVYLLRHYCAVYRPRWRLDVGASAARLMALAVAVVLVFGVALGPFVALGQAPQLLARLFPFKRGLCHAYWAPNAWALHHYAASAAAAATRGLIGDSAFAVLPALPAIALLMLRPCSPVRFVQAVVLCAYASRAADLVPLGLLLVAGPTRRALRMFAVAAELPIKATVLLIWVLCALVLLKSTGSGTSAWQCLSALERAYIVGHVPLFVLTEITPASLFVRLPSYRWPCLVGSGKIAMAAIYGHDGGLWAKSEGLNFEKISGGFQDPTNLRMSGTYIGGTKFMTNQTDKSFIFAKYKSPSEENPNPNPNNFDCVMCAKTTHAIIIACNIADHLIGLGY
ncbi:ALG6, ALG8 glycosyltransferase family-domain-containing protein [Kickxella alabastrina]|uniref:ALG6, ALG8 glycosyltransferase family-domain-containing protein n=1 Tax=Kickxella alabastrina TaxID=61397 RepID=UPI00222018F4|nr:ALG6, ALG8 glycosyltransferase family-domain-containing protein [Kickxella alabastrina]KAI7833827.1 ALG6, ALG8 glycosyltransferase family-domain-containing protein [Kickxella alabastrina]